MKETGHKYIIWKVHSIDGDFDFEKPLLTHWFIKSPMDFLKVKLCISTIFILLYCFWEIQLWKNAQ